MAEQANRYSQLIESIFNKHYKSGTREIIFERSEITEAAKRIGIKLPKNIGDVLYSFRYRASLPEAIVRKAPQGHEWIIRPAGRSRYSIVLIREFQIVPSNVLVQTCIPDATPGIISRYALSDEQALLAKLRYNRLIDIFTGLTCYSLQNHLRTTAPGVGQLEIDEIYIGIDKRGAHYVMPVEAKSGKDKIGIVQVEQDFALCASKFSHLICRPIGGQFFKNEIIVLFEFEQTRDGIRVSSEKHYKLVPPEDLSEEELAEYRNRSE